MKARVLCIGCEQRQLDAERVARFLEQNGFVLTDVTSESAVCVLVTCAVDRRNERWSLRALSEIERDAQSSAAIIVGGCLPYISPNRLNGRRVTGVFSPRDLSKLEQLLPQPVRRPVAEVPDPNRSRFEDVPLHSRGLQTARCRYDRAKRGFKIRINTGCTLRCSYCVIRRATGRLSSVLPDYVLRAYRQAIAQGEPSVLLLGGDTGAYGRDIGSSLPNLLQRLLDVPEGCAIYIHDCNANWLVRDLPSYLDVLARDRLDRRIASICFPVQSGSARILRAMRRPFGPDRIMSAFQQVRERSPDVAIGTHIIVGFPGETDADFEQTIAFLDAVKFDFVTCFRYSEHHAAESFDLPHKVSKSTQDERLTELRELLGSSASFVD